MARSSLPRALNHNAPPIRPRIHGALSVGKLASEALFPLPEESAAAIPLVSSNRQCAISPDWMSAPALGRYGNPTTPTTTVAISPAFRIYENQPTRIFFL